MGINLLVLRRTTAKLQVGGITNAVGVLECVGETGDRAAEDACEVIDAAWMASARKTPPAVLVIGYGERELNLAAIGESPETAVPVISWENGFGHTNDFDFSGLRRLGYAKRLPDGTLALFATPEEASPMALTKAVAAGYTDADGNLIPGRRPRILTARSERHVFWTHDAPSSLGPVDDVGEEISIRLDNGAQDRILAAELSPTDRESVNSGTLNGLSLQEASAVISEMVARCHAARHSVSVMDGGILQIFDGRGVVEMHPRLGEDGNFGLTVAGPGGSGGPFPADSAFLKVADSLAGCAADEASAVVTASGTLAFEIGGNGILVTGLEDGTVAVACGDRLPESFRDAARRMGTTDPELLAADLSGWVRERTEIPAGRVGIFFADFGVYLRWCAAVPVTEVVPGFRSFLVAEGVKYERR